MLWEIGKKLKKADFIKCPFCHTLCLNTYLCKNCEDTLIIMKGEEWVKTFKRACRPNTGPLVN